MHKFSKLCKNGGSVQLALQYIGLAAQFNMMTQNHRYKPAKDYAASR